MHNDLDILMITALFKKARALQTEAKLNNLIKKSILNHMKTTKHTEKPIGHGAFKKDEETKLEVTYDMLIALRGARLKAFDSKYSNYRR